MFTEWLKREVICDIAKLRENPTILKYLTGHRGDGKQVVKVFLREDIQEARNAFYKACTIPKEDIEFVVMAKSSEEIQKIEILRVREMRAPDIDISLNHILKQTIQEQGKRIYAQYSNIIGIQISKVRCKGDKILNQPCIVLHCLDKTIIPFGENPLPNIIAGQPCDVREDLFMLGIQCQYCASPEKPEPGCSIGIPSDNCSGSVGFYCKSMASSGSGFLTASHIAVKTDEEVFQYKGESYQEYKIVHPSFRDNNNTDNLVGHVVLSMFGNFDLSESKTGLDLALVDIDSCEQEGIVLYLFICKGYL